MTNLKLRPCKGGAQRSVFGTAQPTAERLLIDLPYFCGAVFASLVAAFSARFCRLTRCFTCFFVCGAEPEVLSAPGITGVCEVTGTVPGCGAAGLTVC